MVDLFLLEEEAAGVVGFGFLVGVLASTEETWSAVAVAAACVSATADLTTVIKLFMVVLS